MLTEIHRYTWTGTNRHEVRVYESPDGRRFILDRTLDGVATRARAQRLALPDAAGVFPHHRRIRFAVIRLPKLRHIRNRSIHPPLRR